MQILHVTDNGFNLFSISNSIKIKIQVTQWSISDFVFDF